MSARIILIMVYREIFKPGSLISQIKMLEGTQCTLNATLNTRRIISVMADLENLSLVKGIQHQDLGLNCNFHLIRKQGWKKIKNTTRIN
jgi:hypothetical protein